MYFWGLVCCAVVRAHSHGLLGEIKVLAGLAPSSQTVGSLKRTPWLAKPSRKIWHKVSFVKSL